MEAQELAEFRDHELSPTESDKEEDQEMDAKCIDIWEDAICLGLVKDGVYCLIQWTLRRARGPERG